MKIGQTKENERTDEAEGQHEAGRADGKVTSSLVNPDAQKLSQTQTSAATANYMKPLSKKERERKPFDSQNSKIFFLDEAIVRFKDPTAE